MTDSMVKTFTVFSIWVLGLISPQVFFSISTSIIAFIYFGAMLKLNVIDIKYNGSWISFFKSWFKIKKN